MLKETMRKNSSFLYTWRRFQISAFLLWISIGMSVSDVYPIRRVRMSHMSHIPPVFVSIFTKASHHHWQTDVVLTHWHLFPVNLLCLFLLDTMLLSYCHCRKSLYLPRRCQSNSSFLSRRLLSYFFTQIYSNINVSVLAVRIIDVYVLNIL